MRKLLAIGLLLLPFYGFSQSQVKGVVIIHINAKFNQSNNWYGLDAIEDCRVFNGYLEDAPALKEAYGIKSVPTLIILKDKEELARFEGAIDMKLHVTSNQVQAVIDEYK